MLAKHLSVTWLALFAIAVVIPTADAQQSIGPRENASLLSVQAKLGYRLVTGLSTKKEAGANIVASPASVASVFAVLELGASRSMSRALHDSLGFDRAPSSQSAADFNKLRDSVAQLVKSGASGPLSFANAVLFDRTAEPYKLAAAGLKATGADVLVENLAKPEMVKQVNDWVSAHTNGLIPAILDQPPRQPGLIALNALHFKDRWQTPFDPKDTAPAAFHTSDGRSIDVPMMHSPGGDLLFRQDDHFVAVDLPYATTGFSLVVLTSKEAPASLKDFAPVADWLTGGDFTATKGELALPRFSLTGGADLLPVLDNLGLRRARLSRFAFSLLSPAGQVITEVLQKTVIKVDEEGTEAAATTAVTGEREFVTDFVKMTVDKPFMFALRDEKSGLVLLEGYVGDPTAGVGVVAKAQ
jgi:serpin B